MTRWQDPAPGEQDAGERSWGVIRRAYDERLPTPRTRDWRPVVAVAIGVAVLAAAFSPPGLAVWSSIREAVRGERNATPALASLPARGRLLAESTSGVWVVQRDATKRLLRGYRDAAWSPHGLYIAAVHGSEVRAIEANGAIHWSIGRAAPIRNPRWSFDGYRVAYFADGALRVVNGDGTDDRAFTRDVQPGPSAWQPDMHVIAYVNRAGNIEIANVDQVNRRATIRTAAAPTSLGWTADGKRLVATEPHAVEVFWQRGPRIGGFRTGASRVVAASVSPDGKRIAYVETLGARSTLWLTGVLGGPTSRIFAGAGSFTNVVWSPDGRWLLLDWPSPDQWLFIRTPVKKLIAVSNIHANFGANTALAGWCCP